MISKKKAIEERLRSLEEHLKEENPVLLEAVNGFRELDRVAYATGLLSPDDSFAMKIPWWPMISVLGTFSSGKSTFINEYISGKLQQTGNQAVDDKFTVICYSPDEEGRVLPGLALDADIRFPFYKISGEIEKVAAGEGRRIDAYLQLKTSSAEVLRGKILIDSPGFDADAQRTSTLRITNHMLDLSDLVLVFFDARHPEPGAMHDTLNHLVEQTIHRPDSSKFLYILNQIDTAAREDNPEEVVGAWQRALSQKGLTAGRFYCIYNEKASVPIEDEKLRHRFQSKRDADLGDIYRRIREVEVQRAYRIVGTLEKTAHQFEDVYLPRTKGLIKSWSKWVLGLDAALYVLLIFLFFLSLSFWVEGWEGLSLIWGSTPLTVIAAVIVLAILAGVHFYSRDLVLKRILRRLNAEGDEIFRSALKKNTRFWRSIFQKKPVGWNRRSRKRLSTVLINASNLVQALNDQYTHLSTEEPAIEASVAEKLTEPRSVLQPTPPPGRLEEEAKP